jgi:anti-sigma regulatory factor (Ser/Thr protein kinase)
MDEAVRFHFVVDGEDFTSAGQASVQVKKNLRKLGIPPEVIRKISIAMYEGEINMVIHADGGEADVLVYEDRIVMILTDRGPGIADVEKAMQEGYSTAPDNVRSLGFGAGMGLPNMKRYTDDMKIESVVGEGTTITMTVLLAWRRSKPEYVPRGHISLRDRLSFVPPISAQHRDRVIPDRHSRERRHGCYELV